MTRTAITHAIDNAIMTISNVLECVCSGGNSIWRCLSSMDSLGSLDLDGTGAALQPQPVRVQPAVLPVDPVHDHGHRHRDADPGEHVVRGGRAGAALAVRGAGAERHDPRALVVG